MQKILFSIFIFFLEAAIVSFFAIVLLLVWKKTVWKKNQKWFVTSAVAVVFFLAIALVAAKVEFLQEQFFALSGQTQSAQTQSKNASVEDFFQSAQETFKVSRVVDGDTIKLENGQVVRYLGIDSPETVDPQKSAQCFGKEASDKNKELLAGKEVVLVKDVSEKDKYGRILRYVWAGDVFVNDYLVRNGFARAENFPPDEKYRAQFKEAQAEAKKAKRGLWAENACK